MSKSEAIPTPDISVIALQQMVFEFAERTFGPGREDAAWKKLFEELGEVLKKPRDPEEWGDVFILLFDLAAIYGVGVDEATRGKLAKIADRVWARTETGTYQHVPGAVAAPPAELAGPTIRALFSGGPLGLDGVLRIPGDTPPPRYRPIGHPGPEEYIFERTDIGLDKLPLHIYQWIPF